jgi:hypothetical protein
MSVGESEHGCWMIAIALLFVSLLCDCFKSLRRLEVENPGAAASDERASPACVTSAVQNLDRSRADRSLRRYGNIAASPVLSELHHRSARI